MYISKTTKLSLYCGVIACAIGLIAFLLSWNLWDYFDGPLPGYQLLLFPGNLTLIYFWHPLFTEEVFFWPKLFMLLFGQFTVVTIFTVLTIKAVNRIKLVFSIKS